MSRSKLEAKSYLLPSGIATNGQELKHLQRKLLQNHYQAKVDPMQRQTSQMTPSSNRQRIEMHNRPGQHDALASYSEKEVKNVLSQDLMEQMRQKSLKKHLERHQSLQHEHRLSKHISSLDSLEKERQMQFNHKYKMQALEDLELKENLRNQQALRNYQEKQFYRNRYSVGNLAQSTYLREDSRQPTYTNPTKQYYYQVDQALRDRNKKLFNPQGLPSESSFKLSRRSDSLGQLDYITSSTNDYRSDFYQNMRDREVRDRQDLKNVLLSQIREKEASRKIEKQHDFYVPYTTREYEGKHHPIYNPVDIRCAADNPYILRQLTSLK